MKYRLIIAAAVMFGLVSCSKDTDTSKAGNPHGITSTSDLNVPSTFNWRTTQLVSIDISALSTVDEEKKLQLKDSQGNILLTKITSIKSGDKLYAQIPVNEKEIYLSHNGVEEKVRIANGTGAVIVKKGGGYPSNAPCPCDGRMENVTFKYTGNNGATLTVWYKDKGNSKSLSHTFSNLSFGDIISVDGFDANGNSGKTPRLKSQTFLSLNNGSSYWNVHTSCSEYILGNHYGPFEVIAFTDGQGQTCGSNCIDTDGDGCCDSEDMFPNDSTKCDIQYNPGKNVYGSYAWEDLWPATGDFDFNDKIINRNTALVLNQNGDVTQAIHKLILVAAGASFTNGLGFAMPGVPANEVASVSGTLPSSSPYTTDNANGTEAGQSDAVIIVYENWKEHVTYTQRGAFFNTAKNTGGSEGRGYSDTITITIDFAVPQAVATVLEIDPFLIRNGVRGAEIHLPWFGPTDLADVSLFNTRRDASAYPGSGNNYVSTGNIPWAIQTPLASFEWPIEKTDIVTVYFDFAQWALTGSPANWYSNGNRDLSKVY